jgi:hypothetical protein
MGDYCSPAAEGHYKKHGTCFDVAALEHLREAWNATAEGARAPIRAGLGAKALRTEIQRRLASACGTGEGAEVCWVGALDVKEDAVLDKVRKEKPAEWRAKPNKWLSNFDIEDVMRQYEREPSFSYSFLGVVPVDFAEAGDGGACWAPEMCRLQLRDLVAKGKRCCGFIINLDRHDEPGSHWTCVFAVLDKTLPSYGAYYYDSVAMSWPKEVHTYLLKWQREMEAVNKGKRFPLKYNRTRHQYQNTECGMFSMFHQILWIERLKQDAVRAAKGKGAAAAVGPVDPFDGAKAAAIKAPAARKLVLEAAPTTFDMIVSIPIRDGHVWRLRNMFYREVKGVKKGLKGQGA